jgi:hypothetical protein
MRDGQHHLGERRHGKVTMKGKFDSLE